MNKMIKKNIEKLGIKEEDLRLELKERLNDIEKMLNILSNRNDDFKALDNLSYCNRTYNSMIEICKQEYEFEFNDLQKEYEKMLPKINEYLKVKVKLN